MAVSQYLPPSSLIDSVKSRFTPDILRKASSLVGESESSTRGALHASVPTVLSGLVNMVSSRDGSSRLTSLIRDGGYTSAVDNVGSLFGGGKATGNMLDSGQQLMGKIFGNRGSSVADVVAKSSGVSSSSAMKLMSLAAPLTLGVLGKSSRGLDSSSLASTLLNGKSEIAAASPSGLSHVFESGPADVRDTALSEPLSINRYSEPEAVEEHKYAEPIRMEEPRHGGMGWLAWLLIALAAAGLLAYFFGRAVGPRRAATVRNQAANVGQSATQAVQLPGGHTINVPPGSLNYNLASFLSGQAPGQTPKTFTFDNLNFQSDSTQLTPQSAGTVTNLAEILKAYPNAHVELTGHTDNTGDPAANQKLSLDRANTVKTMLVNQGVNAGAITTAGLGATRPVASNDTEQGRQSNRRLELNVLSK